MRLDAPGDGTKARGRSQSSVRAKDHKSSSKRASLCCIFCGSAITSVEDRTSVGSDDLDTFVNPHGEVFRLQTFSRAPGAQAVGRPSREFSWYPGHVWRVTVCGSCRAHLGWQFAGASQFWALIVDRLEEN